MTVDDFEGVSGTFRAVDGTGLPINPSLSYFILALLPPSLMVFFPRSIKKFEKNHGGCPKIFLPQITLTLPYYLYWSQNIKEL